MKKIIFSTFYILTSLFLFNTSHLAQPALVLELSEKVEFTDSVRLKIFGLFMSNPISVTVGSSNCYPNLSPEYLNNDNFITCFVPRSSGPDTGPIAVTTLFGTGTSSFSVTIPGPDPLPVELISFTAKSNNNSVILNWETATEVNNYGFEVEKAINNEELEIKNWEKIGFVQGHGNSNSPKSYSYLDENYDKDQELRLKYRLKQIDTDGTYEYYGLTAEVDATITSVNDEQLPEEFHLSQNYPNPFNPTTTIKYNIPVVAMSPVEGQHVSLKVYDVLGNEVSQLVNKLQAPGIYQVEFNASNLTSGMYFYSLSTQGYSETKKLVLLK